MKSLPEKFEENIRHQLGSEFPLFAESLRDPTPVSIRVHPLKTGAPKTGDRVSWSEYGFYLPERPVFTLDPCFHAGSYYVQEASSMFIEHALKQTVDLRQPLTYLDLCAAPGGKSTHIQSLINRNSLLVSNETIRSRASVLSENIQKWGYANAIVTNNDPSDFQKLPGFFDVVIVDAPCSGEGLFRKDTASLSEWSPGNVQLCSSRQRRILSDVWNALREDGILIYCTCTYNPVENEANLEWLSEQRAVEFLKLSPDPSWHVEETNAGPATGYRFYPHRTRGEGFFLAAMKKKEKTESFRPKSKKPIAKPLRKFLDRLDSWIVKSGGETFLQHHDMIYYTTSERTGEVESLLQTLNIVSAGTGIASAKHDKLIPEHALALSVDINAANFPVAEVNREDALRYLRKETLSPGIAKVGFTLLTYQRLPLGWINVLPNRVNNMYPSAWRIRMNAGEAKSSGAGLGSMRD